MLVAGAAQENQKGLRRTSQQGFELGRTLSSGLTIFLSLGKYIAAAVAHFSTLRLWQFNLCTNRIGVWQTLVRILIGCQWCGLAGP